MEVQHVYEPYQELRAEFLASQKLLRLTTPWTTVEADVDDESAEAVANACAAINNSREGGSRKETSELLSVFKDHHFAYLKPRNIALVGADCSRTKHSVRPDRHSPPERWVDAYLPTVAHAVESLPPWDLDVDECLEHSKIDGEDAFDAASAYRFIMHWVFMRMTLPSDVHTRFFALMRQLLAEDEPAFFSTARFYLRQYHHVTSTSFECLLPALDTIRVSKELVHKLVHEEQGHGRYTADSLRRLGVGIPSSLPVLPESVAVMDLLRITTSVNSLAFACVFNVFELGGEQDEDPIGALLASSSKPEAANGVRAHFDFNRAGAHFTSGIHLLDGMGAVDAYTVIEAARCVELNLMLLERMCEKNIEHGMKSRTNQS